MAYIRLLLIAAMVAAISAQGAWIDGRATMYGLNTDGWSIHAGHCAYGYISDNYCTGQNVAALSDQMNLYKNNADGGCGICVEVKCKNYNFKDGNGAYLQRDNVCYDTSKSVVVQVVDVCPCSYPGNYESNKRWCCGDMPHMDMSPITMAQLADVGKGVIGIQYRQVPCNYRPANPTNGNFPGGKPSLNPMVNYGTKQRPCPGGAQQQAGGSQFRPGQKPAPKPAPKPASCNKKCCKTVGEMGQCGGKFRNKQALPGLKDSPWKGYCCKKGLKCKRFNDGWWSCQK